MRSKPQKITEKKRYILILLTLCWGIGATAGGLDVKELKLKNGLTVWLNEDHSQPKVYGPWW